MPWFASPELARQAGRRAPAFLVCSLLAWQLEACGGRVEPQPNPTQPSPQQGSRVGSTTAGTQDGTGADGLPSDLPLGDCIEGWLPTEEDCPWLASDGRCYATKTAACACICPRDTASTCVSGLPGGANSRTRVSCI